MLGFVRWKNLSLSGIKNKTQLDGEPKLIDFVYQTTVWCTKNFLNLVQHAV